MTKKAIQQENDDLKYWLSYILYRSHTNWRGQDSSYIICDVKNIMIRIENDLLNDELHTLRNKREQLDKLIKTMQEK